MNSLSHIIRANNGGNLVKLPKGTTLAAHEAANAKPYGEPSTRAGEKIVMLQGRAVKV